MARQNKRKNRKTENPKVSSSQDSNDEATNDEPEVWDVVKVISSKDCEKPTCRLEKCKKTAVAVWAANNNPDDTWPVCEKCQLSEFGGWPESVEPPDDDDDEEQSKAGTENEKQGTRKKKSKRSVSPENAADSETSGNQNDVHQAEDEKEGDENKEGEWRLHKILSKTTVTGPSHSKCMTENCKLRAACVYVASNASKEKWYTCLDCQENDFDGWPEVEDLPVKTMTDEHKEALIAHCATKSDIKMPVFDSKTPKKTGKARAISPEIANESDIENPDTLEHEEENSDDEAEVWDLVKIIGVDALLIDSPIKCSTESCLLPAACVYVSSQAPTEKWYTCLDCQEKDYGGWPEVEDLPLKSLSDEHRNVLKEKCSSKPGIKMPQFDPKTPSDKNQQPSNTFFSFENAKGAIQGGVADDFNIVSPVPLTTDKAKKQPSKEALALHKKWLEEAEALGGPGARIIVSKPAAKEKILETIFDAFRPMNITEIFQVHKGVIPKPVLKTCLDDMVKNKTNPFDDSDSEEAEKRKTSDDKPTISDPFAGSLYLKAGKSSNASLYYADYNKAKNGNGLDADERNGLYAQSSVAVLEEEDLQAKIRSTKESTKELLSQPTNDELVVRLDEAEADLAKITETLEGARQLKVNEKQKEQTKRRIENFTTEWRKRRRITMDFLFSIEELSEGTVSAKKCLSGDGQIEMDSDELAEKQAIAFAKKKRSYPQRLLKSSKAKETGDRDGTLPNKNFVAVRLNSQGLVERVLVDDGDKDE